ncbi:MAG: glycerol-3-phosphate 1-O-acyltransferase PlsY [Tepidisphaeraceae bacterium]
MSLHVELSLLAAVSYFIGSIPFGLLVGFAKGKDIRLEGSKNIGATNAGRVLGKKFFWLVFFLDMLKSLVPMLIASVLVGRVAEGERTALTYALWLGVGVAALFGHVFSIYLKFKGGKGVATSAGILLGLWPHFTLAGVIAILAFVVVVLVSRYISLSSMTAAAVFPVSYVVLELARGQSIFGAKTPLLVMALLISGLVFWRHRENIARLRAGTENKIGSRSAKPPIEPNAPSGR